MINAPPDHGMLSSRLGFVHKCADKLPFDVIDLDLHILTLTKAVRDRGFGVEGIGVVGMQSGSKYRDHGIVRIGSAGHSHIINHKDKDV